MRKYSGIYVADGQARRIVFEAKDHDEAVKIATLWNVGIDGEAPNIQEEPRPLPEAYDQETARHLLGGISRTTLYAELATGKLERMPGTRRVLVTRRSIERRCAVS